MEELEDLKGYEGYYKINRAGQVWSMKRQKFMKPNMNHGYFKLTLTKENKGVLVFLHRLLALQFLPNTLGLLQIDHIDRDKTNNSLENLRWISSRGNCLNKRLIPKSGEHHISLTCWNTYAVRIRVGKECHSKTFKTIDEAKTYRDAFLTEHNLL